MRVKWNKLVQNIFLDIIRRSIGTVILVLPREIAMEKHSSTVP